MGRDTSTEIPYPPVFHDWEFDNRRVATATGRAGVSVEVTMGVEKPAPWYRVELTEHDACLLAASLVQRAAWVNGEPPNRALEKLVRRIVDEAVKL